MKVFLIIIGATLALSGYTFLEATHDDHVEKPQILWIFWTMLLGVWLVFFTAVASLLQWLWHKDFSKKSNASASADMPS